MQILLISNNMLAEMAHLADGLLTGVICSCIRDIVKRSLSLDIEFDDYQYSQIEICRKYNDGCTLFFNDFNVVLLP